MATTLLLADDSVTVQRVIELTFADEGMRVVAVGDGRQAIERLDEVAPDIVLADVSMPERDGYDVAAHVKRHPKFGRVPVVLLTGAFDALDAARADAAGYDGVLAKPFEPQAVIALVRSLLDVAAGRDGQATRLEHGGPSMPAPASTSVPVEPQTSADDYFTRLNEVFGRTSHPAGTTAAPQTPADAPDVARSGTPHAARPPATSTAGAARSAGGGPESTSRAAPVAAMADAFDWLLAEELGGASGPAPFLAPAPPSDAFIDAVARRVADRLGEAVVRDVISREVLALAERLVREEIERLKQS